MKTDRSAMVEPSSSVTDSVLDLQGGEATHVARRRFLKRGIATASVATLATPALAQTTPTVRWRLASSFPKSLDTIYGGAEVLAKRLQEIMAGIFQISVHAAGELMPAFGVVDALQNGGIECAHTASY